MEIQVIIGKIMLVLQMQELNDMLNGYFGSQYLQGSWNLLGRFWNIQNQEIHQDGYYSSSSWSSSSQVEQESLLTTSNTENESKTNSNGDMNSSNNKKFTNGNNNTNDNTNTNANDESNNKNLQKYKTHTMKQEITGDYFFKHRKTPHGNK